MVQWCWVNFKCRGVLLILIIVWQEHTYLRCSAVCLVPRVPTISPAEMCRILPAIYFEKPVPCILPCNKACKIGSYK